MTGPEPFPSVSWVSSESVCEASRLSLRRPRGGVLINLVGDFFTSPASLAEASSRSFSSDFFLTRPVDRAEVARCSIEIEEDLTLPASARRLGLPGLDAAVLDSSAGFSGSMTNGGLELGT